MKSSLALPALALLALAFASPPGTAQEVGAAGAVNPAARGTPPARPTRVLELGAKVIHKERIQTTGGGSVQLIFIDKTTLNIGPNSDIVIDEFIYDPNRGAGRMVVSMAKGVLRFVGGNISHAGGATVKTPVATIGIRGGVATIKHIPCAGGAPAGGAGPGFECGTRAINHFGVMSVATATATEIIRRPGFAVTVVPGAAGIPAPQRVSQAEVESTNRQLSSKPGQKGGARAADRADRGARRRRHPERGHHPLADLGSGPDGARHEPDRPPRPGPAERAKLAAAGEQHGRPGRHRRGAGARGAGAAALA